MHKANNRSIFVSGAIEAAIFISSKKKGFFDMKDLLIRSKNIIFKETDKKTKTTHAALLRSIGFSSAPGMIRIFGFNENLMAVTFVGSALWMLACMVVAVKQTLNYKSLGKAFGVVVIAWLVQAFALISILALTRNF